MNVTLDELMEYRNLNELELSRLTKWRGLARYMTDYYGFDAQALTPALMDQVFLLWLNDARPKVSPVDFAYAFGTTLGDYLTANLNFDWLMITDEQGEDFCLKSDGWETYPIQYVWKRVATDSRADDIGFFAGAWDMFSGKVSVRS